MDRNQAKEFYPILQAYAEGKVIECRTKPSAMKGTDVPNDWTEMKEIEFWNNTEYRIKPEPEYRPFANAEECWEEMKKHKPFGWVVSKMGGDMLLIRSLDCVAVYTSMQYSFKDAFEKLVFADLVPFGVKEEQLWYIVFVIFVITRINVSTIEKWLFVLI